MAFPLIMIGAGWKTHYEPNPRHTPRRTFRRAALALVAATTPSSDNWEYNYSREKAAYPLDYLKARKYWPPVKRIDNVYGDKNLFCTCPDMDEF